MVLKFQYFLRGTKLIYTEMNQYFLQSETLCTSSMAALIPSDSEAGERMAVERNRTSVLTRLAVRISRSRWFRLLRRMFHYQNRSSSELGPNPFNSGSWMMMECTVLVFQILFILHTLSVSKLETPIWPMRIWLIGYILGCILRLVQLFLRYHVNNPVNDGSNEVDVEWQRIHEESSNTSRMSRSLNFLDKWGTFTELFSAVWFVMGNVWVFDSRFGSSFHTAPKLHVLCIILVIWNAISYSFPFILFVLFCCCVPLLSNFAGYNMTIGSLHRGASDHQLSSLPKWMYKELDNNGGTHPENPSMHSQNQECCICLAKYKDKEEIRELPCSHIFHLKCVDQWLQIISCCPLCKKELGR